MSKSITYWSTTTLITLGVISVLILPGIVFGQTVPVPVPPKIPESDSYIIQMLYWFVTTVFGAMVGWFGTIFDYTIQAFVLEFGSRYLNTGIGGIIDNLWSTIRDIFNLTFIFGLVYIGFQMILKNNTDAQKSLGYLLAAALLVNFSLFITKFIVDFSNIAAIQIYSAFSFADNASIGTHLINLVGLSSSYSATAPIMDKGGFAYIIGLMMVLIVASFVFAAGAALVTIRYIALNLYLVFSPIMFLGWVFPGMASFSRDYWRGFLGRAFFAPAFVFMIYLSFQILATYEDNGEARGLGETLGGGAEPDQTGETMAFFFLAMGFMIASLIVAQKMGAQGASTAISVGQNIRKRAQRGLGASTAGMAARAGRTAIGGAATGITNNDRFKRFAVKNGRVGKAIYGAAAKVADSSFDARQVAGVGKAIGIGEGKKGGYTTRLKETEDSDAKFLKAIGTDDMKESEKEARKKDMERKVETDTRVVTAKTNESAASTDLAAALTEVKAKTAPYRTEIKALNEEMALASTSEDRKRDIAQQILAKQTAVTIIEKEAEDSLIKLKDDFAKASQNVKDTTKKVTEEETNLMEIEISKIEYANQLQYISTLEKWTALQKKYQEKLVYGAAIAAGTTAGVMTGGVAPALIAAIIASNSVAGSMQLGREATESLRKEYGKDGTKKKKSSASSKRLKEMAKIVAEEDDDKKKDKGDDKKEE